MPLHEQQGSLTLQRKGMATIAGAWVPYWQYDIICLEQSLAGEIVTRFTVKLIPVEWPGFPPGSAQQIVIPTVGTQWFDADERFELVGDPDPVKSQAAMAAMLKMMKIDSRALQDAFDNA